MREHEPEHYANGGTDKHRDPITGEPGAHPVGVGVGTAAGGAAGAAMGAVAGPAGMIVGAIAGGLAGALTGKGVAEQINPTAEDAYWRENFRSRPYIDESATYDEYRPAYRYGWESFGKHTGRKWDEVESDLSDGWETSRERSNLGWDKAKHAARDAWHRLQDTSSDQPPHRK